MKLLTTFITALLLSASISAADNSHDGMISINTCEDSAISNVKAKYWLDVLAPEQPPITDTEYFARLNASPWCYVHKKEGKHNSIRQYDSGGYNHEIQIHKTGEQQWIKNNWKSLRAQCTMPFDLYAGARIIRSYKTPTTARACIIFSRNGVLHNQGDGSSNKK